MPNKNVIMVDLQKIKDEVAVKHGFINWDEAELSFNWDDYNSGVDDVATEYARQCCQLQIEAQKKDFGFGSYCSVEQKRYGVENEFYTYKVISVIKSNTWVDVPVYSNANKPVIHDTMQEVVTCICMGVSEDTVTRFRLSDVKKESILNTKNVCYEI